MRIGWISETLTLIHFIPSRKTLTAKLVLVEDAHVEEKIRRASVIKQGRKGRFR